MDKLVGSNLFWKIWISVQNLLLRPLRDCDTPPKGTVLVVLRVSLHRLYRYSTWSRYSYSFLVCGSQVFMVPNPGSVSGFSNLFHSKQIALLIGLAIHARIHHYRYLLQGAALNCKVLVLQVMIYWENYIKWKQKYLYCRKVTQLLLNTVLHKET